MPCKYIVNLPDGGEIHISSPFTQLNSTDGNLKKFFDSYLIQSKNYSALESEENLTDEQKVIKANYYSAKANLINHIKSVSKIKSEKFITKIIDTEGITFEKFIESFNEKSEDFNTIPTFIDAVITSLNYKSDKQIVHVKDGKEKPVKLNDFLKLLKGVKSDKYFSNENLKGMIGVTSLAKTSNRINREYELNYLQGLPSFFQNNLRKFLNVIRKTQPEFFKSDSVYSFNDGLMKGGWVLGENDNVSLVHKKDDDVSLFQSLFKKLALNINPDELYTILKPVFDKIRSHKTKTNAEENLLKLEDGYMKFKADNPELQDPDFVKLFFNGSIPNKIFPSFEHLIESGDIIYIRTAVDSIFSLIAKNSLNTKKADDIKEKDIDVSDESISDEESDEESKKESKEVDKSKTIKDKKDIAANRLTKIFKNLYSFVSPEKYGQYNIQAILEQEKQTAKDKELALRTKLNPESTQKLLENQDEYFYNTETTSTDAVISTIKPYADLIKFDYLDNGVFCIVTEIIPRNNGLFITGVRVDKDGNLQNWSQVFNKDKKIYFRRLADDFALDKHISGEPIVEIADSQMVEVFGDGENPIPVELIRSAIKKGDRIQSSKSEVLTVVGVYPGGVKVVSKTRTVPYMRSYKNIFGFRSSALYEDLKTVKENDFITNRKNKDTFITGATAEGPLLSAGDIFSLDPKSNDGKSIPVELKSKDGKPIYNFEVIHADGTQIFYKVKTEKGFLVKSVDATKIDHGMRASYGTIKKSDLNLIQEIIDSKGKLDSKSKTPVSLFTNYKLAKKGDLFYLEDGKKGVVLERGKVLIDGSKRTIEAIENLNNPTFITTRDISSSTYPYVERANAFYVEKVSKKDIEKDKGKTYSKVAYVIPKEFKESILVEGEIEKSKVHQFINNYLIVGRYIEATTDSKGKLSHIQDDEDDITEHIKKLFNVDNGFELSFNKFNNHINRNLSGLTTISNFSAKSSADKKEMKPLKRGRYVSLYKGDSIDSDIYQIESVDEKNAVLMLSKRHINGTVITKQITVPVDELLAEDKTHNSIAKLYLLNTDNNLAHIENASDPNAKARKLKSYADNIKKKLGLPADYKIEVVSEKDNFKSGQKAKIVSYEDEKEKGVIRSKIVINADAAGKVDVVHEFLHIFLTSIKYKNPELYYHLINSIVKSEKGLDLVDSEEEFVDKVVGHFVNDTYDLFSNIENEQDFINSLITGVITSGELNEDINEDYIKSLIDKIYSGKTENNDLVNILTMNISTLFNITDPDSDPEVSENLKNVLNFNIMAVEPRLREWLNKNNYKLKCK